jgi:hypothetical protein
MVGCSRKIVLGNEKSTAFVYFWLGPVSHRPGQLLYADVASVRPPLFLMQNIFVRRHGITCGVRPAVRKRNGINWLGLEVTIRLLAEGRRVQVPSRVVGRLCVTESSNSAFDQHARPGVRNPSCSI